MQVVLQLHPPIEQVLDAQAELVSGLMFLTPLSCSVLVMLATRTAAAACRKPRVAGTFSWRNTAIALAVAALAGLPHALP